MITIWRAVNGVNRERRVAPATKRVRTAEFANEGVSDP
jgi:hypothetical protein